jgi:hypothetical protein
MKFNELSNIMQKPEPKPDTYEAGMALNQLLKIGTHAIKIHNMIDDGAEMEAWVAKKIDLASNYVKSVHGYTAGSKAGTYDDNGMSEMKKMPKGTGTMQGVKEDASATDKEIKMAKGIAFDKRNKDNMSKATSTIEKVKKGLSQQPDVADALKTANEDAGEGHMSKSQLYQTAKMAIELLDMIRKGDDLEGWVQTKLNLAADYLQAVYHYEDYQKLNPYREELDGSLMQKHAGIIQKHLDEILERKCRTEDVDTKPGMMRILKKRVNEVEKEIAKENRKETNEATIKPYVSMYRGKDGKMVYDVLDKHEKSAFKTSDERVARAYLSKNYHKLRESGILYRAGVKKYGKAGMKAIQSAAGKGASHQEIGKIKDKHLNDAEDLEEGIKDWAKKLAAAGVIVGAVAGMNSINNAIDNSVPAVQALNTAYELAVDQGHSELANDIKKDLSDVKIRLQSGKDLNFVKDIQHKYSKFVDAGGLPYSIDTEGLAYESKLAVQLKQRLK